MIARTHVKAALTAVLLLSACGPIDRPDVVLGDPVENVAVIRFDSEVRGEGEIVWEAGGVEHVVPAGSGTSFEAMALLPSGVATSVRGRVREEDGTVHHGPARRVRLPKAPPEVRYDVEEVMPGRSQLGDGLLLMNVYEDQGSWAIAIDRLGQVRWWTEPDRRDQRFLRVRPGRDGRSIVVGRWAEAHQVDPDDGWITRYGLGPEQSRTDTRAVAFHHDWVELPDGRFAWLSWVYDEQRWIPSWGPFPVAADAIRVADEGAGEGEETVLYDLLEDYPLEVYWSCSHMARDGFTGGEWREWSHANSLDFDEEAGELRTLVRYWDAVVAIDLEGGLAWEAGGRRSDFALEGWFRHGHTSELAGDRWVIFDNGNHGPEPVVSSTVGLEVDFEAGVVREAWRIPDPRGKETGFLGDARTLPGGNVLVLYSPTGLIHEYTPEGELVWRASLKPTMTVGRLTWTDTLAPGRAP